MLADHRAAAQGGKADRARRARAGMAVADPDAVFGQLDAAARRGRLAEQQRGARRRVDLVAMVHLQDLDVEIGRVERARRLLHQHGEQVDAEAHIARLDDRRVAGGRGDAGVVRGRAARGADHMHDPRLRRIAGKLDGRGRRGEVQHAVGPGEDRQRIVGDRHAERPDAGQLAGIAAERGDPARSIAPATRTPSTSCMMRISAWPMRPAAPTTTSPMSLI